MKFKTKKNSTLTLFLSGEEQRNSSGTAGVRKSLRKNMVRKQWRVIQVDSRSNAPQKFCFLEKNDCGGVVTYQWPVHSILFRFVPLISFFFFFCYKIPPLIRPWIRSRLHRPPLNRTHEVSHVSTNRSSDTML